jgi:hypothetical protein
VAVDEATYVELTRVDVVGNDSTEGTSAWATGVASGLFAGDAAVVLVDQSRIADNTSATGQPAVVLDQPMTTFTDSAIVDNDGGGAIEAYERSLSVERVVISGHDGWAIDTNDTVVEVDDSALVKNGAGVYAWYLWVNNSTIANEGTAVSGDGPSVMRSTLVTESDTPTLVASYWDTTVVGGTIVAGPDSSPRCQIFEENIVVSKGWNIITDDSCQLDESTDLPSTDPLLAPLADNGGQTLTRMIDALSAAIDAIPAGVVALCDDTSPTDQRGLPRPSGAACDIGAVERQPGDFDLF